MSVVSDVPMNLPNIFATVPADLKQSFFAIHIAELQVQAALWKVVDGKIEIFAKSAAHDWHDDDSCIAAVDQSLQELGKASEDVKQTLFALSTDWVDNGGILPGKKPLFQKMTKELLLEPIGFVVTTEALLDHLTETMSSQLSVFLIEVGVRHLTVSLVKHGQLLQTEKVGRSGEGVSDLIEAFAHFKEKVFPTKFMLFSAHLSAEELQELQQQLFGHDWPASYPFLHPPMIEIFPKATLLDVVIQTGGKAVAEAKGLLKTPVEGEPQTEVLSAPTVIADPTVETAAPVIAKSETAEPEPVFEPKPVFESQSKVELEEANVIVPMNHSSVRPEEHVVPDLFPSHSHHPTKLRRHHFIASAIAGVIGGFLILLLLTTTVGASMMRAVVQVQLQTKVITKEVALTVDSKVAQSDPSKRILKATTVSQVAEGEKSTSTTGTKMTGEKAKGKVKIFNRTSSPKTFNAATSLSTGKLKYVLDQTVTVASASTGQNFESVPGTLDVDVTAAEIGTDSNIAKDTELTIESFAKDTYVARTLDAFSGGTSKEIQAVSAEDRTKLLSTLQKELIEEATQELKTTSGKSVSILPTTKAKVVKATYSAEVGKETDTLTLNLTIQVDALSYQVGDLKPLAVALLQVETPSDYELLPDDPEILSAPSGSGSAALSIQTNITGMAKPKVDVSALKELVAGKTVDQATQDLLAKSEIKHVEIQLTPTVLRLLLKNLPKKVDHIEFQTDP